MQKPFSPQNIFKPSYLSFVAGLGVLLAAGCARLDYVKVPTATQYDQWDDSRQAAADSMKGVRYYLPRPYLNLKQSTPVAQRSALVSFTWDPTAKAYLVEGPEQLPTWVRKVAPKKLSITQALALSLSGEKPVNGKGKKPGGEESGEASGTNRTDKISSDSGETKGGPNTVSTERPPSELHARTGFLNSSDPVTRLGSRFDVVYLPDFDEQFAIQQHVGLGKVDIETQLRNGWAAEVFSQKVDNSNLIPYVINQFEHASEAAANIFTTWAPVAAGLPPNLGLPKPKKAGGEESGTAGPENAEVLRNFLGQVLLFKIAEVRIAQPGLYPILKPSEIRRLSKSGKAVLSPDPEASLDSFVQLANMPWIRQDMAFIPCPPFTVIGFNTTSDVFIAPATDRISLITDSTNKEPESPAQALTKKQAQAMLEKALFGAESKNKWGAEKDLIDYVNSEVRALGQGTEIEIKALTGQTFTQAQRATLKATALSFFKNPPLDINMQVTPPKADAATSASLKVTFQESMQDLAKEL